jgi:hypothetical protein
MRNSEMLFHVEAIEGVDVRCDAAGLGESSVVSLTNVVEPGNQSIHEPSVRGFLLIDGIFQSFCVCLLFAPSILCVLICSHFQPKHGGYLIAES